MPANVICPTCTQHSMKHGSTASEAGGKISVTHHHKHGNRRCDFCKRPFTAANHSATFEHPESPARPIIIAPGKHAIVHKGCRDRFLAKLEEERKEQENG